MWRCCKVSSEPEEVVLFASLGEVVREFFDKVFGDSFRDCEGQEDSEGFGGLSCEVGEVCCEDFVSVGLGGLRRGVYGYVRRWYRLRLRRRSLGEAGGALRYRRGVFWRGGRLCVERCILR